jgi:hypothetical protein
LFDPFRGVGGAKKPLALQGNEALHKYLANVGIEDFDAIIDELHAKYRCVSGEVDLDELQLDDFRV